MILFEIVKSIKLKFLARIKKRFLGLISDMIAGQASTDQTNIDLFLPFFISITVAMYFTLLSIFIITCQYAWPTVFLLIPLAWLNLWYRVRNK